MKLGCGAGIYMVTNQVSTLSCLHLSNHDLFLCLIRVNGTKLNLEKIRILFFELIQLYKYIHYIEKNYPLIKH